MLARWFILLVCCLAVRSTHAEVQILMANSKSSVSALGCRYFLLTRMYPMAGRESQDMSNRRKVLQMTREQIYDTYRKLGTVPEAEIASLMKEDMLFPAGAVLYLRSVNDMTGCVEGIMRVVTGDVGAPGYFNHHFSFKPQKPANARVPVEAKYGDPEFQKFLEREFPKRTELGRVVFGAGVNEFRVLMDLISVAVDMSYFPSYSDGQHLLVESVLPAVHRYSEFGLKEVAAPIAFNDSRVLMAIPMKEAYYRHRGNVDKLVAEFEDLPPGDREGQRRVIAKMEGAINKVSSNPALRQFYLYGYYRRAELYYAIDDFRGMVSDVRRLVRQSPQNKDGRLFELFAEAGNLYNWETGQGNPAKAIAYLDSRESQERFVYEALPDGLNRNMRLYIKGLIYLGSHDYANARATRLEMDAADRQVIAAAAARGQTVGILPAEIYADRRLGGVKHAYYDPATKVGNVERAFHALVAEGSVPPMAVTSVFHEYRAQLFTALDKPEESAKSLRIARALK